MSGKPVLVVLAAGVAFGLSYAAGQATESDGDQKVATEAQAPQSKPRPVELRAASELPPLRGARRRRARRPAAPAAAAPAPAAPVRRVRRVTVRRRTVAPAPAPRPAPAPAPAPRPSPSPPPTSFDDSG